MITKMSASSMNAKTWYRSMLAGNDAYSPGAYDLISTAYGTGSSGTITFSSIPAGYKHLQIRMAARDTSATTDNTGASLGFNSDTASNYSRHRLRGDGSSVYSNAYTNQSLLNIYDGVVGGGASSGITGAAIIDILDAFSTSKYKTVRFQMGHISSSSQVELASGSWISTSAISSIDINALGANFSTLTRISLYGIKG